VSSLPSIEALEHAHEFPGPFTYKVFGPNDDAFVDRTRQAAISIVGEDASLDLSHRASSHGRHTCVTLEVQVASAQEVLDVYAALREVDGVRMML